MAKLNEIQSKIFGIRPTSRDQLPFDEKPANPDQIPYLFEGDIILTDEQMETILRDAEEELLGKKNELRQRRSLTSDLTSRWPKNTIPYYIDTESGVDETAVLAGVKRWETETCLSFKRQFSITPENGLEFFLGGGCYSYLGRVFSTFQPVSIGFGCGFLGIVTHEIGHALGLYHEQSRYDRDNYVEVLTENVYNGFVAQFSKISK
ncbi:hypothetical protein KIN20_010147 [Parelaphostrongylus tenuis]|uniref:Metalloendopeptidase n=1 Tax=Parelaphostrongylus tenuis TaxID=148309 RepID=A0AAD5MSV9_PARTN|nr:hypothetical protein KIN20_010147 [Parelaphostrongylus tenuis]